MLVVRSAISRARFIILMRREGRSGEQASMAHRPLSSNLFIKAAPSDALDARNFRNTAGQSPFGVEI